MRLIIDADSCSRIHEIVSIGKKNNLEIHLFHDICHEYDIKDVEIHIVQKGNDSTDFSIINFCKKGDLVITRDGGLAAMVLAKQSYAVNSNSGMEYTEWNILGILTNRHLNKKERMRQKRSSLKSSMIVRPEYHDIKETIANIIAKNKEDSQ